MEKVAINVKHEAADIYYDNYERLPYNLRRKISCYMLDEIFKKMVVPAIDKIRQLDRQYRNNK